jgi:hypothetical protein
VIEEQIPQHEPGPRRGWFTVSGWDGDRATLEARGHDLRSTLEAGLRAVLVLTGAMPLAESISDRSAPVQGEGEDHAGLFAALVDDLLGQLEIHGRASDITVDGVLRRDDGDYLAWGYVRGSLSGQPNTTLPTLDEGTVAEEDDRGNLVLTARLRQT